MNEAPCVFFAKGLCAHGENCRFSHDASKLKSVPICRNFLLAADCKFGQTCRFIHGDECDDCGQFALHPFNQDLNQAHKMACMHRVKTASKEHRPASNLDCFICLELLVDGSKDLAVQSHCNHVMCFECLEQWRKSHRGEFNAKLLCPACRQPSGLIVRTKTRPTTDEERLAIIEAYKVECSQKRCRFYERHGFCRMRAECPFAHCNMFDKIPISQDRHRHAQKLVYDRGYRDLSEKFPDLWVRLLQCYQNMVRLDRNSLEEEGQDEKEDVDAFLEELEQTISVDDSSRLFEFLQIKRSFHPPMIGLADLKRMEASSSDEEEDEYEDDEDEEGDGSDYRYRGTDYERSNYDGTDYAGSDFDLFEWAYDEDFDFFGHFYHRYIHDSDYD